MKNFSNIDIFDPRALERFIVKGLDLSQRNSITLQVDIKETEQQYIVSADVPGVEKNDIQVRFVDNVLYIEVNERKINEVKEGEKIIRSERYTSKKSRSFEINDDIDETRIEASYNNGVLDIVLPKKEKEVVKNIKQIEIK